MKQKFLKLLYRYLALCSRYYISRTHIQVIAITGSVGKTSCRMVVAEVLQKLSSEKKIYTSPKNYNSELGLVFSIFQIEDYHPSIKNLLKISFFVTFQAFFASKKYDILIAEFGIDAPEDMDHLLRIASPDIAVLTKLDAVHSANFPNGVEGYWQEKWKLLFAARKKVYLNLQDDFSQKNISFLKYYGEIFGKDTPEAHLFLDASQIAKWKFEYRGKNISLNLLGKENIVYTKLALDIAEDLGITLKNDAYNFDLELQEGRFTLFQKSGNIFIDSTYNAAPESMKQVLENVFFLQKHLYSDYHIITVLGDMRELGKASKQAHKNLKQYLQSIFALFTVGPEMYQNLIPEMKDAGFKGEIFSSLSSREIGQKLKMFLQEHMEKKFIILFKGSQNTIFTEEALAIFLTKQEQAKIPRQSLSWKEKKEDFFKRV